MAVVVGKDQSVVKRITCRECSSIVEYEPREVRNLYQTTDYDGGFNGVDGFNCPSCNREIHTRRW